MRTERHPMGYAFKRRFPDLVMYAVFEGGAVFLSGTSSPCYVVMDEGTLAELLDETEDAITIHIFETPAEREQWLNSRPSWERLE